ncbi:hypothetical protein FM106_08070 [Brachybacterium faecium]|nr:hypothetical protein FM106_08070 [Brachybacterium faecium]
MPQVQDLRLRQLLLQPITSIFSFYKSSSKLDNTIYKVIRRFTFIDFSN